MSDDEGQTKQRGARMADARVAAALDHWWASLGREFGPLSRPQRRVLRVLADREAAGQLTRVGDIATLLQVTTAGATRMLDTITSLGYATRYRSPQVDQRQVHVALSPAGRDALAQSDRAFNLRVAASLAPLSASERQTLAALLERLAAPLVAPRLPTEVDAPAPAPGDSADEQMRRW